MKHTYPTTFDATLPVPESLSQVNREVKRLGGDAKGVAESLLCYTHRKGLSCGKCPIVQQTSIHGYCVTEQLTTVQYRLLVTETMWALQELLDEG